MPIINVTAKQLAKLIKQMNAAPNGKKRFPNIVMPNGRKLANCTLHHAFGKISDAFQHATDGPVRFGLKTKDGRDWSEVLYIELVEMMRDGEIARLLLEKIENH